MDPKYPTLRRPKRKLCYVDVAKKECPSKQWFAQLSMGDVDKMFDDIDPSSHNDDVELLDPAPMAQTSDADLAREAPTRTQQEERPAQTISSYQKGLKENTLHSTARSPSPEKDIVADLDLQFKDHGPVKTSSPIEENMIVKDAKEMVTEKHRIISPILFACEDEGKEEAEAEAEAKPGPSQKLPFDGDIIKHFDDSGLESPPSRVILCKPKTPSHKNNVEGSCKNNHPVKEQAPKKQITADMDGKRKVIRQQHTDPAVTEVRQEPGVPGTPEKKSDGAPSQVPLKSIRVEKDMTTFLQKLRGASQPKPSCSRKSLSPVKVPTPPPETEEDFCILEDDAPLWISIPRRTATLKKQIKTCSSGKDSSSDKGAKDGSTETAQKPQESEPVNDNLGCQDVDQNILLKEGENNEMVESGCVMNEFCSPEPEPAVDLKKQEKPNKKKRFNIYPSEESDMAEEQPEARRKMDKRKNTQKFSDKKRSRSLKGTSENTKTSKVQSLKEATKQAQVSDAAQRTEKDEDVNEQHQELSSEEQADAETCASPSDKEILNSEAQTFVKDKQNEETVVTDESSYEGSQTFVRRKRRNPGQWWVSCPQTTEERKVTDKPPTPKKSKQRSKEPTATTGPLPAKSKKDRVFKKRELMPPATSSSPKTTKAKEQKTKQKRNRKEDRPVTIKTRKVLDEVEAEPIEEQQKEDLDQDPYLLHFSPLDLSQRHRSFNSEHEVFQRVYHNISKERTSRTPAWEFPSGSKEQRGAAEPEKRRRNPPSDWWLINGEPEEVQSISPQAQQQEPKPHKQRQKHPKQNKSPEIDNMAVLQKPAGRSPVLRRRTSSMSKSLRSGPSSMIVLQPYEQNDVSILSSSRVSAVLSASDICGPPLKPLILQPKDKANLKEWFKCLWSTTINKGPEITPDQFDWYFHRGRAIGILVDINCGSICTGKMLLGSFMKKPLWVDHSATTVFNISTSSVSVIMNSSEYRYNPGQSFMVSCGHAYSIENITAEPAVLYFTRIFVDSSD